MCHVLASAARSQALAHAACSHLQNMTPEQLRQMRAATQNMTGDQIAAQVGCLGANGPHGLSGRAA